MWGDPAQSPDFGRILPAWNVMGEGGVSRAPGLSPPGQVSAPIPLFQEERHQFPRILPKALLPWMFLWVTDPSCPSGLLLQRSGEAGRANPCGLGVAEQGSFPVGSSTCSWDISGGIKRAQTSLWASLLHQDGQWREFEHLGVKAESWGSVQSPGGQGRVPGSALFPEPAVILGNTSGRQALLRIPRIPLLVHQHSPLSPGRGCSKSKDHSPLRKPRRFGCRNAV